PGQRGNDGDAAIFFDGRSGSGARSKLYSWLADAVQLCGHRTHNYTWLTADNDLGTSFGQFQFADSAAFKHVDQVFNALDPRRHLLLACIHLIITLHSA